MRKIAIILVGLFLISAFGGAHAATTKKAAAKDKGAAAKEKRASEASGGQGLPAKTEKAVPINDRYTEKEMGRSLTRTPA